MTIENSVSNYISQLPGNLNLHMVDDNDLVFSLNWGMDITDYTFEGNIISSQGTLIPITIDIINPSLGIMNLTITATSILDAPPSKNRWYLDWEYNGLVRTVISGSLILYSR